MKQWGDNYNTLYGHNSVLAVLVFVLTATVYFRTRIFNFETMTFTQLSFSLGWLIEFYILSPNEKGSFTITYAMLLVFPVALFLFDCAFIQLKNKPLIISGTLLILLVNLFDPGQISWEYSLITAIILCFLLFFFTRFTAHYRNWKYQKIFLYTLLITFVPYLLLQNVLRFISDSPKWLEFLIYEYQLPNYFLLIFPFVLGYKLIKNNELEFTLNLRDYLIQLFLAAGLISLVSYLFLIFLNIPYGTLMLLLLSIYLIYIIVLTWQQQFFLYRFKNLEKATNFNTSERTQLKSNVSYGEYLNTLSDLLLYVINSVYSPKGICLIQKHGNYFMIFAEDGTLEKMQITKELKLLLAQNTSNILFKSKTLTKKDLAYSNQTIGWLLMEQPTLSSKIPITTKISEILFLTDELEKRQISFIPQYVSIYKDTLRDTTYLKKMEQLRKEVSYYLHDDVLQNILALKKISEVAINSPTESRNSLILIENELENMNLKIREKMFDLYPSSLMDFDFNQSVNILVNQLIEARQKESLPDFVIDINSDIDIPKELRFTIYRMLKELINNAIKYANANKIQIEILDNSETVYILVHDDGIGFDLKKEIKSVSGGFGLLSIMQEVDSLSGQIQIKSKTSAGTSVEIILNRARR